MHFKVQKTRMVTFLLLVCSYFCRLTCQCVTRSFTLSLTCKFISKTFLNTFKRPVKGKPLSVSFLIYPPNQIQTRCSSVILTSKYFIRFFAFSLETTKYVICSFFNVFCVLRVEVYGFLL